MRSLKHVAAALGAVVLVGAGAGAVQARSVEDCQLKWGQAVRSYLTQNRTKGPEDVAFKPACDIEAGGDKPKARVEAAIIGAMALAKLDMKGCKKFMEVYMQSSEPQKVCEQAAGAGDKEALRTLVAGSLPPPKSK